MTLEREPATGWSEVPRRPFRLFKLAWVFNALAALLAWIGLDGTSDILGHLSHDPGAFPIFLAGATSGALADASALLMSFRPGEPPPRRNMSRSEFLVGLAIVFLVVSVVCLVLGIAAAASGVLDLAAI